LSYVASISVMYLCSILFTAIPTKTIQTKGSGAGVFIVFR